MKQYQSYAQKKAKYKKRVAIFISALMALSIIGFIGIGSFTGSNNNNSIQNIEYNGYTFVSDSGLWKLEYSGTSFYFANPPTAVDTIEVPTDTIDLLTNQKVYITKNDNDDVDITGFLLFYKTFFLTQGIQSFEACLTKENCADLPIISCEDTAAIVAKIDDETYITNSNKCIILAAPNEISRAKLAERLAYELIGVI